MRWRRAGPTRGQAGFADAGGVGMLLSMISTSTAGISLMRIMR